MKMKLKSAAYELDNFEDALLPAYRVAFTAADSAELAQVMTDSGFKGRAEAHGRA